MLVLDDNMFKIARMQEALLRVSKVNKEENLNNYIKTVKEIDSKAFESILEEVKHIDEHNQSLENELQFLETIKNAYNQLFELQLSFKNVCETYGGIELKLSDLSKLNIEYIENRINAINGYLVNLKNIEVNKVKLQELNNQLIDEEKKKELLNNRLLELESVLRDNFSKSEGRCIVDGNLGYTSVILEYEKIGLDYKKLLNEYDFLKILLSETEKERKEISEKVSVAEVCYNNILTAESRQILNEINVEYLKINYKLSLLRIVELLTKNIDDYDMFIKKRENLVDLIRYRASCMEKLGIKLSIDPFARTKVKEQLDAALLLNDNSKVINTIMKELSELSVWTEKMLSQNNNYLIVLSDTKDLIENAIGLNDIDVTSVSSFDEILVKQEVLDNQVVSVRSVSLKLNMNIVTQKTTSVIKRVYQMMNESIIDEKDEIKEELIPELVIIPKKDNNVMVEKQEDFNIPEPNFIVEPEISMLGDVALEDDTFIDEISTSKEVNLDAIEDGLENNKYNMFETIIPFEEPLLFVDRADDNASKEEKQEDVTSLDLSTSDETDMFLMEEDDNLKIQVEEPVPEMPEAFWVTKVEENELDAVDTSNSFDEQINALLSSDTDCVQQS